ncbi:MAG: PQQ-binding-like beta-propeller repeat protein [Acidimicrobiia bacterium]|nr:PQQ-binding-like beta-propeller repeat protein [Acidimicrobiia bacterium]
MLLATAILTGCGSEPISIRQIEPGDSFDLGDTIGSAAVLSIDPDTGAVLWSTPVPEVRAFLAEQAPLLTAGDLIVAAAAQGLVALDLADGRPKWQVKTAGVVGAVGRSGGRTIIDARDADAWHLAAVDDGTGRVVWESPRSNHGASATIGESGIFLVDTPSALIRAIDPTDGADLWTQRLHAGDSAYRVWYDGSQIYVPGDAGELVALGSTSGEVRWRQPALGPAWLATGSGHVAGWFDFDGAGSSFLGVAAADDGRLLWSRRFTGSLAVDLVDEVVLVAVSRENGRGRLIAIDARAGRQLWRQECRERGCRLAVAGAADGLILVGDGDRLLAMDQGSGRELWSATLEDEIGRVLVSGGRVYVGTSTFVRTAVTTGMIGALDLADGTLIWQQRLDRGAPYRPVLVGSQLLVLAHNPTPAMA